MPFASRLPSNERETPGLYGASGSHATPAQLTRSTGPCVTEDPSQPDNLWHPVPGDHGTHGGFAGHSRASSVQTWLTLHRSGVGIAAGLGLGWGGPGVK